MRVNWIGHYDQRDGYGRFNARLASALHRQGVDVQFRVAGILDLPNWVLEWNDVTWDGLTISCMPPYMVKPVPGRHWLFSMTEGSELPAGWADAANAAGLERVLVPCEHNAEAFRRSGVEAPISVVPGGTDPDEFALPDGERPQRPYTFFALADRGFRKGWQEVWDAFYLAFGGKTTGTQDVRLIVKGRPHMGGVHELLMQRGADLDRRIIWQIYDAKDIRGVYAQADCVVIPSRSEGWGMPHREAAMMGLPVITQAYSGLDDGHTHEWAIVVQGGRIERVPEEETTHLGDWRIADVGELAAKMRACYEQREWAASFGRQAAAWLREHQTWDHSARALIRLISEMSAAQQATAERQELQHAF